MSSATPACGSNISKVRAVVLDLDGTVIGPDERITPAVGAAIGRLSRQVPVSIATGRCAADLLGYARQLELSAPQVCDGGATILDPRSGEILWRNPLGPDNARRVLDELRRLGSNFIATFPEGSVKEHDRAPHWDITRISALDILEPQAEELADQFSRDPNIQTIKAYLPYNDLWAVDFTSRGVDKGSGAAQLGRLLGVDTRDMAAAGDSYNDLALLEACGLGIAMGNAAQEVKAVADYLAPGVDQDGLAWAIEEILLPRVGL